MLAHLLGLLSGFVGPLILYLVLKPRKDMSTENSRHALNFQISIVIYYIITFILFLVIIGFFLMIALSIFVLVVEILGAVRAYNGEIYKYPLEIPFVR